jgi:hypothetical protein
MLLKQPINLHYNKLISNSNNKMKTTWKVIKSITGRKINNIDIQFFNSDVELSDNHHIITDYLNYYFSATENKINTNMQRLVTS